MQLAELKRDIENNTVTEWHLIFEAKDESAQFVVHQYLKKYCEDNNLTVNLLDGPEELPQRKVSLFGNQIDKTIVNLLTLPKLDKDVECDDNAIVWIIADKVDKSIDAIRVPKLEDWQLKDYAMSLCPEETEEDLEILCNTYKKTMFRLDNELQKLALFDRRMMPTVKDQLFTDVEMYSIFDLTNAIMQHDVRKVWSIYRNIDCMDVEPYGLVTILKKNFKNVIDIQCAKNPTAAKTDMSEKQFWAVKKYNVGRYSNDKLLRNYEFILSLDGKIKMGEIDVDKLVDIILVKVL